MKEVHNMKKYEVIYSDRHSEIVDSETVNKMINELEMFERTDVSQIHLLKDDGDFDTIWTEEEGLFVRDIHDDDDEEETSIDYKIYPTDLLNKFYLELFSTDFRGYDSSVQNCKTDHLFDYDNFEEWFDNLIDSFVEDTDCDETELRTDLKNCPKFIEDMKFEYEDLKEICGDFDDDDEE